MKRIIFATGNQGKLREIREILRDLDVEVISMKDAGIQVPIEENGNSFIENALIKARTVEEASGEITMADDSGLEVDALNKEPGIYSARYMGEETSYRMKNENILERLQGVPEDKRTARFVCAIACVFPDGQELTEMETFDGCIGYEERGSNGFGYDPIFFDPSSGKSAAQLTRDEKNARSHRGNALRALLARWAEFMQ